MASEIKNPLQLYVAGENASTYFSRFLSASYSFVLRNIRKACKTCLQVRVRRDKV